MPASPNLLQSPVPSEGRSSTSSASNTTGCYLMNNNDHDDEDFEEEPIKLWSYVLLLFIIILRLRENILVKSIRRKYNQIHSNKKTNTKEICRFFFVSFFSLTEDHKRMIRCVRKMQLIVARNRFQVQKSFISFHSMNHSLLVASEKTVRCS